MTDRDLARALVDRLESTSPELLRIGDVDLRPALEQHLYLRLWTSEAPDLAVPARASAAAGAKATVTSIAGSAGAVAGWVGGQRALPVDGDDHAATGSGVVLVLAAVHCRIWDPIGVELARRGSAPLAIVRAARFDASSCGPSGDLTAFLGPRRAASLLTLDPVQLVRLERAMRVWRGELPPAKGATLQESALRAFARMTAQVHRLDALIDRLRPPLLVTYAELNEWARVVAAVGRARGVPTLDLPHAETAHPESLEGLDFDRIGVFGPRSAAVLREAGFPAERIAEIGAPHFDGLVGGAARSPQATRRLLFTSQFLAGQMTDSVKTATVRAAIAAAEAVAPSELIVKRHPVETDSVLANVLSEARPRDVTIRMAEGQSLRELLDDAWLLVTGWSNTVFEAALRGVPSLTINATRGAAPMPFAEEGLSEGAIDAESAADLARRFLEEDFRAAAVARARERLPEHLGPQDGRASERAADLVEAAAQGRLPRVNGSA